MKTVDVFKAEDGVLKAPLDNGRTVTVRFFKDPGRHAVRAEVGEGIHIFEYWTTSLPDFDRLDMVYHAILTALLAVNVEAVELSMDTIQAALGWRR